ncbi:MAG: hypothetical protein GXY58_19105 [Planctomycetaceae bacterium]|nr:hypothetical protein [Planctomycetaceae bacterium]
MKIERELRRVAIRSDGRRCDGEEDNSRFRSGFSLAQRSLPSQLLHQLLAFRRILRPDLRSVWQAIDI